MIPLFVVSICHYSGVRSVCTSKSVIVVDDKIATIPQREFYQWTTIVNVSFTTNSALTTIGANAFDGCTMLETFTFPPKLQTITDSSFGSCRLLTAIHLPSSLKSIGASAFRYCSSLNSISADDDIQVTSLPSLVFGSTAITSFEIWPFLTSISGTAFDSCALLSEFVNTHDNPHFTFSDGLLFAGTAINIMPMTLAGDFVIPAWVTSVMTNSAQDVTVDSLSFEPESQMTTFGAACFYRARFSFFTFPDSTLVTAISSDMFNTCSNLMQLTIPNNIQTMGFSPFYGSGLTTLDISSSHPWFSIVGGVIFNKDQTAIITSLSTYDVENYVIPKEVTSIGDRAFRLSRIKHFEFEEESQLNTLGITAFYGILQTHFSFDVDCPLESIPTLCFSIAANLKTITLPKKMRTIEGGAFSGTGLTAFLLPDDSEHLISIDGVLYSLDKTVLFRFPPAKTGANYVVPSSVEVISTSAFETCTGIQTLTFEAGSKLNSVKKSAFASSSITSIVFSDDSNDVTFETECFTSSSVKYVTLPGKMKIIKQNLFKDCFDLVGIVIPESASSIETGAFSNCESLTKLSIPQFCGIRSISKDAFANTRSLTELELPYLVNYIVADSLPSTLEKLTIWGSLTPSVVHAVGIIPTLQDVYILCGFTLDTSEFTATGVTVHQICFTKRMNHLYMLKFMSSLLLLSN